MKKQILLIEDSETQALVFKSTIGNLVKEFNHELVVFGNGLEALEYVKNNQELIDLVILDLNLSDISGFDILSEISKLETKLPVIVLSADSDKDLIVKSMKLGASNYFVKASSKEELKKFYNAVYDTIKEG